MSQSRKARGRLTEEIVADYLRGNGFPHAERRPASLPGSDIIGTPGIDWEVKARRGLRLTDLLRQQADRATDGTIPVGVIRPDGWGPARVADWPTVVPLSVMVALLRSAGYGTPTSGITLTDTTWSDPVPRVLPDPVPCPCGGAPGVTHGPDACRGPECAQ